MSEIKKGGEIVKPYQPGVSLQRSASVLKSALQAAGVSAFSLNESGQVFLEGRMCGRFGTSKCERTGQDLVTLWLEDTAIVKLHKLVSNSGYHVRDIEAVGVAIRFEPPRVGLVETLNGAWI